MKNLMNWNSVCLLAILLLTQKVRSSELQDISSSPQSDKLVTGRRIVLITALYERPQRMADFTMLIHTISHMKNAYWIVVEDGNRTNPVIEMLLRRVKIPTVYLHSNDPSIPCHDWAPRNKALEYIRKNKKLFHNDDVVYFLESENSVDLQLFDKFARNVEKMGAWAAGSGYVYADSQLTLKGQVVGWNTPWRPKREFALGFKQLALNIKYITETNARFDMRCAGLAMEDCFLRQLNISKSEIQSFGHNGENKPMYVWHRRSVNSGRLMELPTRGSFIDIEALEPLICSVIERRLTGATMYQANFIAKQRNDNITNIMRVS